MLEQPTKDELEKAYAICRAEDSAAMICGFTLSCLAEIIRGSPRYAPARYSDAEIRLAKAVLVLRAAVELAKKDKR